MNIKNPLNLVLAGFLYHLGMYCYIEKRKEMC